MSLITLDFETYFADDYSLSKMTTEEYVRGARFKVHMTGLKGQTGLAEVIKEPTGVYKAALCESAIVCHHAHFDGLILNHHYNIKPAFWFDTLSMARLVFPHAKSHSLSSLAKMLNLEEKTVPYESFKNIKDLSPDLYSRVAAGCARDVDLTHAVFQELLPLVPKSEFRLIDLTIRMFTEPALRLNREILEDYLNKTTQEKEDVLHTLGVTKEELGSAARFAGLLKNLGVEPPKKISKTTGKETYAFAKTDSELKELLDHDDLRVSSLVAARLGVKSNMVETRAKRLLEMDSRGFMCVYLKYFGAHTSRWSGGDSMNWQNFKRGSVLREAILAPDGYVLCVIDLAQIEARMLNWLAGQQDKLQAYKEKRDLYSEMASVYYGREITKADKTERMLGKVIILACGYGMGGAKFKTTAKLMAGLDLDERSAGAAVASYRAAHPKVVALWRKYDKKLDALLSEKYLTLPNGVKLDYSRLRYDGENYYLGQRHGEIKTYGAKLVENVVQALSRVVLSDAMLKISERYKVVTCTHDEVVYLAPKEAAEEALAFGMDVMKTPPAWCSGIPLDAEGGFAENYSK